MTITCHKPLAAIAAFALLGLSACAGQGDVAELDHYYESRVSLLPADPKIEVTRQEAHRFVPASPYFYSADAMGQAMGHVANDWRDGAMGALHITVTASNHARAEDVTRLMKAALASHGVTGGNVQVTQLTGISEGATVSWSHGHAHVPDCPSVPWHGLGDPNGCAIDRQIAAMVADPKDLTGTVGVGPLTGEYAAAGVRRHVGGELAPDYGLLDDISTTD